MKMLFPKTIVYKYGFTQILDFDFTILGETGRRYTFWEHVSEVNISEARRPLVPDTG